MPFKKPTLTELRDRAGADLETRIDGADVQLPRGNLTAQKTVVAGASFVMHEHLGHISKQVIPGTATSENLQVHAQDWGKEKKPATPAKGNVTATGTDGAIIQAETILQRNDEVEYSVDQAALIDSGSATLAVTAVSGGRAGNCDQGTSLSFTSPVAGVQSSATVAAGGLTGGDDEEDDEALRGRIRARMSYPPHGGNKYDYEAWALEVAGVTRAWCIELFYGRGTVGVLFVRDDDGTGTEILPDAEEIAEVESHLLDHVDPATGIRTGKPVGAALYVFAPTAVMIDFEIDLTVASGYDEALAKANIQAELEDYLFREGVPTVNGTTLHLSRINEVISSAEGEYAHTLITPPSDPSLAHNEMAFLNSITWS